MLPQKERKETKEALLQRFGRSEHLHSKRDTSQAGQSEGNLRYVFNILCDNMPEIQVSILWPNMKVHSRFFFLIDKVDLNRRDRGAFRYHKHLVKNWDCQDFSPRFKASYSREGSFVVGRFSFHKRRRVANSLVESFFWQRLGH